MKKILLVFATLLVHTVLSSQTFTDDFESYTVGDMLAETSPDWETWTSANGGADDVAVSSANAHSGNNSIYFSSTSTTGGPADVVLPFPAELNVGQFNLEMWLYINAGTGAYFNLQEESAIGTSWASEIYFLAGGIAQFTSDGDLLLAPSFPEDEWFKLRMENNLSSNTWEIFINDISVGGYANTVTQIASIDIYPTNGNQFYIDDFSYEFIDYALPVLNAGVTDINNLYAALAGQSAAPQVVVRNLGQTNITSFTIEVTYNNTTFTQDVTGVNIASLAFYNVDFTEQFTLIPGNNEVVATISGVNGMLTNDDNTEDDVKTLLVNPTVPAAGKKVVAEEGTGTWCPWCVRGTYFMELLSERYDGLFVGIAVHNADPMVVGAYDSEIGTMISGYPSGLVDRGPEYDPSQFEAPFLERIQTAPKAFIENGALWNADTRELQISATTTFQETVTGNYKIALVLTEDDVTGTGSQWSQANAYAGGNNGDMGGFEDLPSPVPFSQMEYDHVARVISPSFNGLPSAFAGMMNSGDASIHNFTFILPAGWDETKIHIVAMVIAPDGTIDNASSTSITEAVQLGYQQGMEVVGITSLLETSEDLALYPVPARDFCVLEMVLQKATELTIEIYNAEGKLIANKDYGTLSGAVRLPINVSEWSTGIYKVRIVRDGQSMTKTVVKD